MSEMIGVFGFNPILCHSVKNIYYLINGLLLNFLIIKNKSNVLIVYIMQQKKNICFSRIVHDFFSTGRSKIAFVFPVGKKMYFMTR